MKNTLNLLCLVRFDVLCDGVAVQLDLLIALSYCSTRTHLTAYANSEQIEAAGIKVRPFCRGHSAKVTKPAGTCKNKEEPQKGKEKQDVKEEATSIFWHVELSEEKMNSPYVQLTQIFIDSKQHE